MLDRTVAAIAALLTTPVLCPAQELVVNGSFEDTTLSGCAFNQQNVAFSAAMMGATAFGAANEVDVMEGDCGYGLAPQNGSRKLGLGAKWPMQIGGDAIALELLAPVAAGGTYELSFYGHAALETFSPEIGDFEVGLSDSPNEFGTLVYTGTPGATAWTELGGVLVAPVSGAYLTIRQSDHNDSWGHLDNVSLRALATTLSLSIDHEVRQPDGSIATHQLGSLSVAALTQDTLVGQFNLHPHFAALDNCYDFRWISVLRSTTVNGEALTESPEAGLLPAIHPPVAQDAQPFHYGEQAWNAGSSDGHTIRVEGERSTFIGSASSSAADSVLETFDTFLVLHDVTAGDLAPDTVCVLAGFSWSRSSLSGTVALVSALPTDPAPIQDALSNGVVPGQAGAPGFANWWTAATCPAWSCPGLFGAPAVLSATVGGDHVLHLNAGMEHAGATYLVLGSISGTSPGLTAGPGSGGLHLALVPDVYFAQTLLHPNVPPLYDTLGTLDTQGYGEAHLLVPGGLGALAGLTVHHAFVVADGGGTVVATSAPTTLTLTP